MRWSVSLCWMAFCPLRYQLGLYSWNLAIYGSFLIGSLVFHALRGGLPPLKWRLWLLLILPMAFDGGTQLVGWWESTWELWTLTGDLFGLACCRFVFLCIEWMTCGLPLRYQASNHTLFLLSRESLVSYKQSHDFFLRPGSSVTARKPIFLTVTEELEIHSLPFRVR